MNRYLFVYGTLLSGAAHPMGARLRREATLIADASMQGLLYDLGRYPGLVETADREQMVRGELYKLNSPGTTLRWLDAYEGVAPRVRAQREYERVERPARLACGRRVTAWVYLCRKSVRRLRPIPDGCWVPRGP